MTDFLRDHEGDLLDFDAGDDFLIEILPEIGLADRFKLYVRRGDRTLVRICRLRAHQVTGCHVLRRRALDDDKEDVTTGGE